MDESRVINEGTGLASIEPGPMIDPVNERQRIFSMLDKNLSGLLVNKINLRRVFYLRRNLSV